MSREAKEKFVEHIFKNDYENVEAYMGYFKVHNVPEGLNFIVYINDYTPLTAACDVAENLDIVKLLIKYGADVNMRNGNGITPLEMAILNDIRQKSSPKSTVEISENTLTTSFEGIAHSKQLLMEIAKFLDKHLRALDKDSKGRYDL